MYNPMVSTSAESKYQHCMIVYYVRDACRALTSEADDGSLLPDIRYENWTFYSSNEYRLFPSFCGRMSIDSHDSHDKYRSIGGM